MKVTHSDYQIRIHSSHEKRQLCRVRLKRRSCHRGTALRSCKSRQTLGEGRGKGASVASRIVQPTTKSIKPREFRRLNSPLNPHTKALGKCAASADEGTASKECSRNEGRLPPAKSTSWEEKFRAGVRTTSICRIEKRDIEGMMK